MNINTTFRGVMIMAISIFQLGCSVLGIRSEETPKYQVESSEGDKEIRLYSPYIVAKTTVQGDYDEASKKAFRILAGYIFGANQKKQSISMTAPVVTDPPIENEKISMTAPVLIKPAQQESEKLAMTAPVTQLMSQQGWVMTFMMPSKFKLEDLPTPTDNRISFEQIPTKMMGVIRFSGFNGEKHKNEKSNELRSWIEKNGRYEIVAGPFFAGYDPPWTIPFLRRNEMMFEVKSKK
jgi:hypothetical protein